MFTLTRTLPNGTETAHSPVLTMKIAIGAAGHVLHDGGYASIRDAREFMAVLALAPIGETVEHASGNSFRIDND